MKSPLRKIEEDIERIGQSLRKASCAYYLSYKVYEETLARSRSLNLENKLSGLGRELERCPREEYDEKEAILIGLEDLSLSIKGKLSKLKIERVRLRRRSDKLIEDYAYFTSQVLCRKVHTSLPREIRDLIYEFIIGDKVRMIMGLSGSNLDRVRSWNDGWWVYDEFPAHVTLGFMGDAMLREFMETWYRTTTFGCFSTSELRLFLKRNRWDLGLDASKLVTEVGLSLTREDMQAVVERNLRDNIWCADDGFPLYFEPYAPLYFELCNDSDSEWTEDELSGDGSTESKWTEDASIEDDSTKEDSSDDEAEEYRFQGGLEDLFRFKPGTHMRIYILTDLASLGGSHGVSDSDRRHKLNRFFENEIRMLFPFLKRLHDAGYRVVLSIHSSEVTIDDSGVDLSLKAWAEQYWVKTTNMYAERMELEGRRASRR
ncbi:hypothetical protein BDV95DRAFT_582305 [Massariosphaeria phaeospora]|uniref:Uncharacterized protein n=1 Tax=Massariosphaeria phaeospora TaxID=100035 RepID=A0A7C8I0L3_9PLEO|nr:hypothetical protein BDV95DRAFT_582305 [Massariosphaeria phaeospora]